MLTMKAKRAAAIIAVNLFVIVTMLYAFEGALRLSHKEAAATPLVGNERYNFGSSSLRNTLGHPVTNNSFEFREREIKAKPKGIKRIMALGDSLTWGVGLDVNDRYTNVLERMLPNTEVLNFGFPGRSTVQERDILKKYIDIVQPDLIVIGFCYNDPHSDLSTNSERKARMVAGQSKLRVLQPLESIGLGSTYNLLSRATMNTQERLSGVSQWEVGVSEAYETGSAEWQAFTQALRDIKSIADSHGLPAPIFAVLNSAVYTDKPTDYKTPDTATARRLAWYHAGESAAKAAGLQTLNYEPEMATQFSDSITAVSRFDAHPNAALNRVYARKLLPLIQAHLKH